jgi:hypothetical protein
VFTFAIGLVLPSAEHCEGLSTRRPEAWSDLLLELRREFKDAKAADGPAVCFWWTCLDLAPAPEHLEQELWQACRDLPHVQPIGSLSATQDLDNWLGRSAVLLQMQFPAGSFSHEEVRSCDLVEQRCARCPASFETRIQHLRTDLDGIEGWSRRRGSQPLKRSHRDRKKPSWAHAEQTRLIRDFSPQSATNAGTRSPAVSWAEAKSCSLQQTSDRILGIQAAALGFLVIAAQALQGSLLPPLLLLLAGAWWMGRQPQRLRAQQWLCLSDGLWVQDLWHCFRLTVAAAEGLPQKQPLNSRDDHGALVGLLRSHEVWLALQPLGDAWGRRLLVESDKQIRARQAAIERLIETHTLRRRVQAALMVVALGLALTQLTMPAAIWPQPLLWLAGTTWLVLRFGSPVPLVDLDRLLQHRDALQEQRRSLERALAADNLAEPNLRASVLAAVRRLGEEVLDLCRDGLVEARSRRRWLP